MKIERDYTHLQNEIEGYTRASAVKFWTTVIVLVLMAIALIGNWTGLDDALINSFAN